jgi:acetyl-CoA synthetase/medium-chain acyl-CoA synthetase
VKGLRIGRRKGRSNGLPSSPLELALKPALSNERWQIPDRFNFTRDVVEPLAADPKRRALTFLGKDGVIEPRTFTQISEGASRWAAILREHGVRPDDRVVVLAGNGLDWLEVILGVIKVGGVSVPCSPTLTAAALEVRVSATEPALVVADHAAQPAIDQMTFKPEVHYFDDGVRRRSSDVPEESPTHDTSSRDLAFIITTPGTAGVPKGVAHTHGSLYATRVATEHWLDAGRGDSVWCTAPPESAHAIWSSLAGPWSRGAEVVLHHGEFDPLDRLDLLYRLGPTIACQSPAEYRALAGLRELERFRSPRLRRLVSTGDYLEPEIIEAFEERWGLTIHDGYGQTETNIVVANGTDAAFKPGSLGRALPGHHVAVIGSEGDELPAGIEGDLAVRGRPPTLFAGYWESADETKSAFRGDWYLTGDVALADDEGFFWFLGRAEDVISSRGRTFGPYEVERVLREHAAIAASAVVGLRDLQRGGQFVRAYVVPRPGKEGSEQLEAELRQFVGQALPEQQVPREIVFVEELPTVLGRVSRHALRERPVGGRPLWELPPTSEPEAEQPPVAPQPMPPPPTRAEAAPVVDPPVAPPAPPPVEEVAPLPATDPEPVVAPEPVAEAAPVSAPEPPEPEPVAPPEPAPEPLLPEPELIVVRQPEPAPEVTAVPEPVPEPEPPAELSAAPEQPPVHTPEFTVVPEPDSLPDFVVEPSQREPDERARPAPEPEPVVAAAPEPLPDFIVPPAATEPLAPPPAPEPEPEPDLGPLPDYVVDPSRPPEPRLRPPEQPAPSPLTSVPEPTRAADAGTPPGLYFPPATSFPTLRDEEDDPESTREAPRQLGRRPTADSTKGKRGKPRAAEPGDESDEVSWMQGLSNRLSAYSLADEGTASDDEPSEAEPEDSEID